MISLCIHAIGMARLAEQEQQEIIRSMEAGKPLPDKFRFLLFEDTREVELVWNGKTSEVGTIVLPFQVIEQVDEPRAAVEDRIARLHRSHKDSPRATTRRPQGRKQYTA